MNSFLDKFFRWLRFKAVVKYIPEDSIVCDLGCGADFYFLKKISGSIKKGIGLDKDVKDYRDSKFELKKIQMFNNIPFKEKIFDVVTMIAALEHLKQPQEVLNESFRILKKGGRIVLTTPTPLAKPILEILAKLWLINKNEIQEHKNYFWPKDIKNLLLKAGFKEENIKNYFFEFRFNCLIIAEK